MDPLLMLESKEVIKKTMEDCKAVIDNTDETSIQILARAIYNTNSVLDALIEDIVQDQVNQSSNQFISSNSG